MNSTRKSVVAALGWPKTKSRTASTGGSQPASLPDTNDVLPAAVDRSQLPSMPPQTCILLKFLVDFLIKKKLHKNDLFLLEAKPNERRKLLLSIQHGDIPEKLSQYSSRSVSRVLLELLDHSFAPLLRRECFAEISRMDLKSDARACIDCVVRSMRDDLLPEQSALLESLLLLLYKLSLKATPQMNAAVLGEVVGAKLVSSIPIDPSTRGMEVPLAAQIGHFLVANTPEILLSYRQIMDPHHDSTLRVQTASSAPIHDSHRAKEASLSSAAAIILGRKYPRDELADDSKSRRNDHRKPLDARVAATLSALLTTIIDSNEDKFGLYVDRSTPTGERDTSEMRLKSMLAKDEVDSVELTSHDPVSLSRALRSFLLENVQPLLTYPIWSSLTRNQIADVIDRSRFAILLRETIVRELTAPTQDVVLLLLATVRLALDAGTDPTALEENLAPCLLPTAEDPDTQSLARTCVGVLFSEMHSVVQLLLKTREHQAIVKPLRVCVLVIYWVLKLRRRSRQRRDCKEPHDEIVNGLAQAEFLHAREEGARISSSSGSVNRPGNMSMDDADEDDMASTDEPSATVTVTLSEWLYHQQLEPNLNDVPFKMPPPGYSDSVLDTLTNRLGDVLFVMGHSRKQFTGESGDELSSLLDYLGVNAVLVPRKRAHATLDRIQKMNQANKTLDTSAASLRALEVVETLIEETQITLRHPVFATWYPCLDDQLTVLLDVWGLADRAVTFKPLAEFELA